jgi:recombinational DNA repair protein (RecF pathway)
MQRTLLRRFFLTMLGDGGYAVVVPCCCVVGRDETEPTSLVSRIMTYCGNGRSVVVVYCCCVVVQHETLDGLPTLLLSPLSLLS